MPITIDKVPIRKPDFRFSKMSVGVAPGWHGGEQGPFPFAALDPLGRLGIVAGHYSVSLFFAAPFDFPSAPLLTIGSSPLLRYSCLVCLLCALSDWDVLFCALPDWAVCFALSLIGLFASNSALFLIGLFTSALFLIGLFTLRSS